MTQPGEILIGNGGGDHVSIRVKGKGYNGEGWTGQMKGYLRKGELQQFAQEIRELNRKLVGTAELDPLEPNLRLTLEGDGRGHIAVEGMARNDFASGTKLDFKFEIDQTYLNDIAQALSDADAAA
jgi:hypothetical protein